MGPWLSAVWLGLVGTVIAAEVDRSRHTIVSSEPAPVSGAALEVSTSVTLAFGARAPGCQVTLFGVTGWVPAPSAVRNVEPAGAVTTTCGVSGPEVGLVRMTREGYS